MRSFTDSEQALLRLVEQFGQVEKYQGITPEEMLFSFDKKDIERLLDEEILEKAKLTSYSQKVKGLRFTVQGLQLWNLFSERVEDVPLLTEAGLLVRDVFLHTRLSFTEEAVNRTMLLKYHSKKSLMEAYEMGLVAKVKIKHKHREEVKGYIVTSAGYAYLKGNKLI